MAEREGKVCFGRRREMRFEDYKREALENEKVRAEYDALEPEFQIIRAMLDARREMNLSQKQLAEKTGIDRADISRLENGNANPSLKLLKRIADGLGKKVKIEFVPK